MMIQRITYLFQLVTTAANLGLARPHIAGWSETIWDNNTSDITSFIEALARARARCLPNGATIIGYRRQIFDLQPNRIIPAGSATFAMNLPGTAGNQADIPQMGLSCTVRTSASINTRRFVLRGIPDAQVVTGEFDPSATYLHSLNQYLSELRAGSWDFVCRDLNLPSYRVVGIIAGVITVSGPHAIPVGAFVRLLRVRDQEGSSVTGVYRVTSVTDPNTLVVANWGGQIVGVSGAIRQDQFAIYPITGFAIGRITTRRVGRPFEQYRGRRSRRRAM